MESTRQAGPQAVSVGAIARRFWPYARPYRWTALAVLVAGLLSPALEAGTIWLFKIIVDRVLVPRDFRLFWLIAAAYLLLTAAGGALSFATGYLSSSVSGSFVLSLRTALFRHVQGLSLDFLERARLGDLLSCITSDVSAIESFLLSGAVQAAVQAVRVVVFGGALFYLGWRLALVALLVTPLFLVAARKLSRRIRELSRERRKRSGLVCSVAEEALSNVALVQAYCCEELETGRLHREGLGALRAQLSAARMRATFAPLLDLVEAAGGLAVLGAGVYELSRGRLTLGGLLVFLTYLGKLYRPVRGLSSYNNTVYAAAASAERILHLLDQRPAAPATAGARRLVQPRGLVEFEHVSFTYPGTLEPALEDVSFRVAPGETLAIIGRSGAGKSTVLKLLLRFYDPDRGRILFDGQDLRELEPGSVRAAVAVLLQESYIFHGTVEENIAYGRPGADAASIERAARLAAADEFIRALPAGYATETGQKGRRLSGGQRQRIAIARAMIRDAAVLVLDEPTTGLDADAEQKILAPLRRLMSGRATILVSHNLRATRLATRLVLLEKGRLVAQGLHADLLVRSERYASLWRQQEAESLLAAGGLAP